MSELFNQQDKSLHNTRNVKALIQSHYDSVTYGTNTLVNYATHLWNNLPNKIETTNDLLKACDPLGNAINSMLSIKHCSHKNVILLMGMIKGPTKNKGSCVKGSGTLYTQKCPWKKHIEGMWIYFQDS